MSRKILTTAAVVLVLAGGLVLPVMSQDESAGPETTTPDANASQPVSAEEMDAAPSPEDVLQDLLQRRRENPIIEPAEPVTEPNLPAEQATPTTQVGTAPGVKPKRLLREGQFIITRRGYLSRATGGMTPWMFTFESDGDAMADPPMFMMPCRQLENMERIVGDRGADVTFLISGQVFLYRQQNYLLPTMVKIAPDRGNLQP